VTDKLPEERCETCRFSRISINETTHTRLCMRYPPNTVGTLVPITNQITGKLDPQWRTATAHVQVSGDSWCGEWSEIKPPLVS
jgi:hypothetical protein